MHLPGLSRPVTALFTLAWLFVAGQPAWAQERPRPSALALKVAEAPSLDGNVLDDPIWLGVAPVTDFWQTAPDAGQPASERTEVRVVYTADTIYFGVVCYDSELSGHTISDARRDSSLDDSDGFRILLDTYKNGQSGFVFGTNPAGLEYDGQVNNEGSSVNLGGGGGGQQGGSGGGFNLNWDGSWQVRTTTTGQGWSAEFAIPFRTLRFSAGTNQEWGVNFERSIRRRKEKADRSPLPFQFDLLRVSMAGTLGGLDVPSQRNLKLIPYALGEARQRGNRAAGTTMLGDLGADLKYSVTPSLTLDATYNTDFAQVEVDEQQINLDRFNLFFPEKRPFFLENAGLFAVGSAGEAEVFFSRRIGIDGNGTEIPIVGGGRLSGLAGPVDVGVLNMQTKASGTAPANNFTVARVKRDLPNRTNVGAIFVNRQATGDRASAGDRNTTLAVDGRLGLGRTGLLTGFAARSATPGLSSHQDAYQIEARNETQPLTLRLGFTDVGSQFNPEVGFLRRRGGFRKLDGLIYSRLRPKSLAKFQELRPHSNYRAYWDPNGFQQTGYWHVDQHWELKSGDEFHTGFNLTREGVLTPFEIYPGVFVPGGTYDHGEAQLVLQSNQGRRLSARTQVTVGGFFGGDRLELDERFRLRVGETFNAEINWTRNDIDLPVGRFVTNLARARVSYSFSPRVFVQGLIQYNDRDQLWSSNFRFGWLQQANTGVFVVYTDSNTFEAYERGIPPARPDRSVIVKISQMFDVLN